MNIHSIKFYTLLISLNPVQSFCTDLRGAIASGKSDHYECRFDGGRISDCRAVSNSGRNNGGDSRAVGRGNGGDSHDLVVKSDKDGKIFVMKDGSLCTQSEVLQATALFGQWAKGNPALGIRGDNVLQGAQAIIMGVAFIFKIFNNDEVFNGIKSSKFANLRSECSMEYISHECRLLGTTHPCFKNFDPKKYCDRKQPQMHYSEEDKRKMNEPWYKELCGHR